MVALPRWRIGRADERCAVAVRDARGPKRGIAAVCIGGRDATVMDIQGVVSIVTRADGAGFPGAPSAPPRSARSPRAICAPGGNDHGQSHAQRQGNPSRRANRSEEHTSELQSLMRISYAVFCLKKKTH